MAKLFLPQFFFWGPPCRTASRNYFPALSWCFYASKMLVYKRAGPFMLKLDFDLKDLGNCWQPSSHFLAVMLPSAFLISLLVFLIKPLVEALHWVCLLFWQLHKDIAMWRCILASVVWCKGTVASDWWISLEGLSSVLSRDSGIYCFAWAVSLSYNGKGSRCLSHQPFSVYHNYTGGERQSIQR